MRRALVIILNLKKKIYIKKLVIPVFQKLNQLIVYFANIHGFIFFYLIFKLKKIKKKSNL